MAGLFEFRPERRGNSPCPSPRGRGGGRRSHPPFGGGPGLAAHGGGGALGSGVADPRLFRDSTRDVPAPGASGFRSARAVSRELFVANARQGFLALLLRRAAG